MSKVLLFNFNKQKSSNCLLLVCVILLLSKINATPFYVNDNSTKDDPYNDSDEINSYRSFCHNTLK